MINNQESCFSETRRLHESEKITRLEGAKEEKAIEIASELLKRGTSVDFIHEVTGLSREKIVELQNTI